GYAPSRSDATTSRPTPTSKRCCGSPAPARPSRRAPPRATRRSPTDRASSAQGRGDARGERNATDERPAVEERRRRDAAGGRARKRAEHDALAHVVRPAVLPGLVRAQQLVLRESPRD